MTDNKTPSTTGDEQDKPKKPGTFSKDDPRINRAGRKPGTPSDPLRLLALQISDMHIDLPKSKRKRLGLVQGEVTILESILYDWALSLTPAKQQMFIERLAGKVANVNVNQNSSFDFMKYKDKFTDSELEAIAGGADPLEILFAKIPNTEDTNEEDNN